MKAFKSAIRLQEDEVYAYYLAMVSDTDDLYIRKDLLYTDPENKY